MNRDLLNHLPFEWKHLGPLLQEREQWTKRPNEQLFLEGLRTAPPIKTDHLNFHDGFVEIGLAHELSHDHKAQLEQSARKLIPWKKGPFKLFGLEIDGEWRSDHKWERIAPHLPDLGDKNILDIGCNNGYFMFRMLEHNPKLVLGIDPVVRTWAQFHYLKSFTHDLPLEMALIGVEHLSYMEECFDLIFSMGIIYHHPDPIGQLKQIKRCLRPGGKLILETIGIPGDEPVALFPQDRYAMMRNIWFLPTTTCLMNWAHKAKFKSLKLLHSVPTSIQEQRTTPWCNAGAPSLEDFLDPNDPTRTVEGHPAPLRMTLIGEI